MIHIRQLSKSYGNKKVLDGIDLSFEGGKVYGIVGRNGAGKTTLFKCLASIEDYDGEIDASYDQLKNQIGFLETNPILMSRITGLEYLRLLTKARRIEIDDFEAVSYTHLTLPTILLV